MIPFEVIALSPYAREMLSEITSRRGTKRFNDAARRVIDIRQWKPEDWTSLMALHGSMFALSDRSPAFPPLNPQQRVSWLEQLTTRGPNLVARCGDHVVGHAALIAYDESSSYELVLFVHPDYRSAGIGGALLDSLLDLAARENLPRIWLTGDRYGAGAAAFYRRRGFRPDVQRVGGRDVWTLDPSDRPRGPFGISPNGAKRAVAEARTRLVAIARALRVVMIPLVCAVVIATVSENPRGRILGLILAAGSVLFGLVVEARAIVFGERQR